MYLNHKKLIFLCEMSRAVGQIFAYSGVGERKRYIKMEWDKMDIFSIFLPLCPLSFFLHLRFLRGEKDNSHWKILSKKSY